MESSRSPRKNKLFFPTTSQFKKMRIDRKKPEVFFENGRKFEFFMDVQKTSRRSAFWSFSPKVIISNYQPFNWTLTSYKF